MKNIPKKLLLLVLTLVIGITLVACGNNKDEEAVKKAITETTVQTEVSANFDLPAKSGDVTIVWTVEGNCLALGTVADDKQPVTITQTESDQSATLKATFKLNKASDTKTYPVKVKAKAPVGKTDAEKVADAITKVTVANEVTANFDLPTKQDEVEIAWTVTGNGLTLGTAANNKLPVTVTRTTEDQTATLKAAFTLGSATDTKEFTVKVTKEGLVDESHTARAYFEGAESIKVFNDRNYAADINLDDDVFTFTGHNSLDFGGYTNDVYLNSVDKAIKLYSSRNDGKGNLARFEIAEGFKITKVEFEFLTGTEPLPKNAELVLGGTTEVLNESLSNTKVLREGLSINGFTFANTYKAESGSSQIWIKEIKITYEAGTPESILGGGDVDPELTDQEKVDVAVADVIFTNKEIKENTTLDLLTKGLHDVIISWEATTGLDYINLETGKVTLPTTLGTYDLVLEATFKLGEVEEKVEYIFELIVPEVLEDDFIIHEDFENAGLSSSYGDNKFVGDKDVVFTYSGARDEDTFGIENKGILFRGKKGDYNPSLNFTVNGLSLLYFEYRKSNTGATGRQLELYINGELVQTTDLFGAGSGDQKDVYTFVYDIKHLEKVNISIRVATNAQIVVDNIRVFGPEAVVPKLHTVNFDTVDRDVEILDGTQVRLPDAPKAPVNYKFAGWTLDGVIYDFDLPVTKDLNLVAKFEVIHADVTTIEELITALENDKIRTIKLINDITTDQAIIIDREVALDGNSNKIIMTGNANDWDGLYIIQVNNTLSVFIENVEFVGGKAAILVNGSIVEVSNITLTEQGFGGIEVSQGEGVTADPRLTVSGTITHDLVEFPVIWIDGKTTNNDWVDAPFYEQLEKEDKNQLWFIDSTEEFEGYVHVLDRDSVEFIFKETTAYSEIETYFDENGGKWTGIASLNTTGGKKGYGQKAGSLLTYTAPNGYFIYSVEISFNSGSTGLRDFKIGDQVIVSGTAKDTVFTSKSPVVLDGEQTSITAIPNSGTNNLISMKLDVRKIESGGTGDLEITYVLK